MIGRSLKRFYSRVIMFPCMLLAIGFHSSPLISQQVLNNEQVSKFSQNKAYYSAQKKTEAINTATEKGWVIKQYLPGGGQAEIISLGATGIPQYYITDNVIAAISSGTNELWADSSSGLDLNGNGFIIGEWDGGRVRHTHQEFNNGSGTRVTLGDGQIALSDHSTHVAGTLIARGFVNTAHGMAPLALLHSYDWDDDISEMADEYNNYGLVLSNHSYGFIHGWYEDADHVWWWYGDVNISEIEDYHFGFYDEESQSWDSLAYLCPYYTVVKSAGNDRGSAHSGNHWVFNNGSWVPSNAARDPDGGTDGYDCIGNIAVAKNILTVGAVNDVPGGYTGPGDVTMTTFSSWGPTDDGRIKPDIVANGVALHSSIALYNSAYGDMSGTSMASPAACGTLALLQDYHDSLEGSYLLSSALKALVINTAFECGTSAGPDYSYGWGLLNSVGAANLITKNHEDGDLILVNYLFNTEAETYSYYSFGDTAINVTICWTDPPALANSPALNPTIQELVNDLDLRIISEDGMIYYPWVLNPSYPSLQAGTGDNTRDNVEKITITSPPAGDYTIQVSHKGTIGGQQYSLVISGLSSIHQTNTWTGTVGAGWNNGANWSLGHPPTGPDHVVIPSGCPYYPVLNNHLYVGYYAGNPNLCHDLAVNAGATLTLGGKDLNSAAPINISGILIVGDDLVLNNQGTINLASTGTIYTGYTDGYDGSLILEAGSSVTQSGGNIYTEEFQMDDGSQYNATAGIFHLYRQGTANSLQYIQVNDADIQFYNFNVDTLAQASLDNSTFPVKVAYYTKLNGNLSLNGCILQTYYMNVYGDLSISSGTLSIMQTGPVFYNSSLLTMSGGELSTNNSLWFNSGSGVNITGGTISIRKDLYNQAGEYTPSGGTTRFYGNLSAEIKGATTFYNLVIEKSAGISVLSAANVNVSGSMNTISGKLTIRNSTFHSGSGN
jgi:hypothetical protein